MTPTPSSERSGATLSLLLVEDDDNHAHLVQHALRRGRLSSVARRVSDGAEALAFLRAEGPYTGRTRPDIVLLDLNLPKIDGLEVLRQMKADETLRTIPVVMMTTSDAESDRELAYLSYVNSYVLKPTDVGQFRRLLDGLTEYWGTWNRPSPAA
jgi:CheY-like chemotaxis protein